MGRKPAFTLVELLVVLAIVAMLVAALMPVVSLARASGQRSACAGHLRSLGQALTAYTQRYGVYPGGYHWPWNGEPAAVVWPTRLREFTGRDPNVFFCPSRDDDCRWRPDAPGAGPAATDTYGGFGYEPGEPLLLAFGEQRFSYGYNMWGVVDWIYGDRMAMGLGVYVPASSAGGGEPELRATRVKHPSEMIAIGDSTVDGIHDFMIDSGEIVAPAFFGTFGSLAPPGDVHSGGSNILFCDGSVRWYSRKDLTSVDPKTPVGLQTQRMWFYDHEPHHN